MKIITFYSSDSLSYRPFAENIGLHTKFQDVSLCTTQNQLVDRLQLINEQDKSILVIDSLLPGLTIDDIFFGTVQFLKTIESTKLESKPIIIVFAPTLLPDGTKGIYKQINSLEENAEKELIKTLRSI